MKKEYSNPEIYVIKLQQPQMLCSSLTDIMGKDDTPVELFNDTNDIIVDESSVW